MSGTMDVVGIAGSAGAGAVAGGMLVEASGLTAAGMIGGGTGIGMAAGPVGMVAGGLIGATVYGVYMVGRSLLFPPRPEMIWGVCEVQGCWRHLLPHGAFDKVPHCWAHRIFYGKCPESYCNLDMLPSTYGDPVPHCWEHPWNKTEFVTENPQICIGGNLYSACI